MSISLSLDRFEGKGRGVAVLVGDQGETLNFPRSFLPAEAKPGDVLTLSIEIDPAATARLAEETKSLQDKLGKRDPGGDIKL